MLSRRGHLDRDALVTDRERKSGYCALTKRSALQMGASGGTMKVASVVKRITFLIMTMALAVAMVACQGAVGKPGEPGKPGDPGTPGDPGVTPNLKPLVTAKFTPVMLVEEGVADTRVVSDHFHDLEGQALRYAVVAVEPEGIVTNVPEELAANEAGDFVLTITPLAMGSATITVTATDPDGMSESADIEVTVDAEGMAKPRYLGTLSERIPLLVGGHSIILGADIEKAFDEIEDEPLDFSHSVEAADGSAGGSIVWVTMVDNTVTIIALAVGDVTVIINATDTDELTETHRIAVAVFSEESAQPGVLEAIPAPPLKTDGVAAAPIDVSAYFSDPVGDTLKYAAKSSDRSVATAAVAGSLVTITPKAAGTATVTITATNSLGLSVDQTIIVTVDAPIPDPPGIIRDILPVNFKYDDTVPRSFTLKEYFEGATSYIDPPTSDNTDVATVAIAGEVLWITPEGSGRANVTVIAVNSSGQTPQTIIVDVADLRPLNVIGGTKAKVVRVNDTKDVKDVIILGKASDIDLPEYFVGGTGGLTFKEDKTVGSASSYYTVTVSKGKVSFAVRQVDGKDAPAPDKLNTDGFVLVEFGVIATDTIGLTATKLFEVQRNMAPALDGIQSIVVKGFKYGVGTQAAVNTDKNTNTERPNLNQKVITIVVKDAEKDSVEIVPVSKDESKVRVAANGKKVTITGIATTYATATGGVGLTDKSVTVEIKAVDVGGLESKVGEIAVTVVAAPTVVSAIPLSDLSLKPTVEYVIPDVTVFFMSQMGATLRYKATPSPSTVVILAPAPEKLVTKTLKVVGQIVGETTITLKASDEIGQYAERQFDVTVTQ